MAWNLTGAGDFDCDGLHSAPVGADVNADGATTALAPFEDWTRLVYDGGLVGLGDDLLPDRTVSDEGPATELMAARDALDSLVPTVPTSTPTPAPTATPQTPGPSGGSTLRPAPSLSGLRIRPGAFRATRRAARGARVSLRLSEAGRIRVRVERVLPGRRRGDRCVAPRKAPRGRRRERRQAVRGSFRRSAPAGASSFRFGGLIGGKALKPGRYVLVATPLDGDGRAGTPRRARFRIAR